jgi:hypothetical protein
LSSSETNPSLKIIKINVLDVGEKDREGFEDKIIQTIKQKYAHTHSFELKGFEAFFLLKSTIEYGQEYELKSVVNDDLQLHDFSETAPASLPLSVFTTFTILIPTTTDSEQVSSVLEQYQDQLSKFKAGVGIVRGLVFSILDSDVDEELSNSLWFLSPFVTSTISDERRLKEVVDMIESLAVYTAELAKLHNNSKKYFSVLEVGESEISERVESYLWKLLGPEPVDLETLETWLSYLMERESTVSAIIGNMMINNMEAKSIISKVENVFIRINERSFKDYPKNLELEAQKYSSIIRNFEHNIVRSEALKSRLDTTMEKVRTYLDLQRQKLAIEEQRSSKEQLEKLVNLQEMFHKVEIFIVAVYITEMAHIIFEVLAHEMVNVLTAIFIPIALVIAIGVSRLLHKE